MHKIIGKYYEEGASQSNNTESVAQIKEKYKIIKVTYERCKWRYPLL